MALGKEPKSSNDDLQAITTLLTLVLEKSSRIDELDKTIKAIDFNPKIVTNINRELLSDEIAEKLKYQGVSFNKKKTFSQRYLEDWKKNTLILGLSVFLACSIITNYRLSKEINDRVAIYDESKKMQYSTSKTADYTTVLQNLLDYRDVKSQETKSKKSKK